MMSIIEGRFSSGCEIRITIAGLATIMMATMIFGFLMSIILAVVYSFQETTTTHCGVKNYLPSISAAIAVPPSSYLWRFVIVLCAGQRLFLVSFHYSVYASVNSSKAYYFLLCRLCFLCEMVENLALIGLTCISSTENFYMHENMFICFQVCSMVFMILLCTVQKMAIDSGIPASISELRTLKWLCIFCMTNVSSFIIAIIFYFRHNTYCETGVYTLFALFEYLVVLSNIAFHYIVTFNFQGRELILGGRIRNQYK